MDEETFKYEMAQLRKYERNAEWFPFLIMSIFWGALWWNDINPEPQINAVLGAIAVAGYLIYREACSARAMAIRTFLLAERERGRAEARRESDGFGL